MADKTLEELEQYRRALVSEKKALDDSNESKVRAQEINVQLRESGLKLALQAGESTEKIDRLTAALLREKNQLEESKKALKALNDEQERAKKVTKDFEDQLAKTIKTFTGVTESSDTLIGSFFNLSQEEGGLREGFKKLGETTKKIITPFNVFRSSIQKLAEGSVTLALANDQAMASFNGATGAGGRFNDQILALEKNNRRFGIGAAEAGAALQNLIGGLSGFGLMAEDTQTALADEVAELSKLGVAASDTTGVFQSATKTFGMTTDAAMDLNQEAETLAQELGISVGQAIGDLNKALPQLAVLAGDEVAGAFERLSEQAIETGLSIDQLTSIADKFMTFEAAGKAASSLNAVLGTQMFDTMSLLEAQLEGPQAFIDTFREQLQGSVGDFDSLTVFQKQAIANAAGLSVVEVRNLMNAEALTEEEKKQGQERAENLKAAMSLMDELKAVALELTVNLSPAINGIKIMLDGMSRFLGFLGQAPYGIGAIAQIITLTLIPSLIKTVAQGGARLLMENRITMAIRQQTMAIREQMMLRRGYGVPGGMPGPAPAPVPGAPGGGGFFAGKGGRFLRGAGVTLGLGMGAYNVATSEDKGKSLFKGILGAGAGFLVGGPMGAAAGFGIGSGFADGTDNYPGGPLINFAGEGGKEELIIPPPGSAIVNNENTEKLAKMGGGGGDQAVVAAINNLSTKMDALMQRLGAPGDFVLTVNKREFGRLTNEHFGAPGSSPVSGVG